MQEVKSLLYSLHVKRNDYIMQAQKVQQTVWANEKECFTVNRRVFVLFSFMNRIYAQTPPINIHDVYPVGPEVKTLVQVFFCVYASSEGSGESVHLRRYVQDIVPTSYVPVDSSYDTGVVYITTPTSSTTGTLDFQKHIYAVYSQGFFCVLSILEFSRVFSQF